MITLRTDPSTPEGLKKTVEDYLNSEVDSILTGLEGSGFAPEFNLNPNSISFTLKASSEISEDTCYSLARELGFESNGNELWFTFEIEDNTDSQRVREVLEKMKALVEKTVEKVKESPVYYKQASSDTKYKYTVKAIITIRGLSSVDVEVPYKLIYRKDENLFIKTKEKFSDSRTVEFVLRIEEELESSSKLTKNQIKEILLKRYSLKKWKWDTPLKVSPVVSVGLELKEISVDIKKVDEKEVPKK